MMNKKVLLEDEALTGIEPHPHSYLSGIFTQVARVAIEQFEKEEKYAHHRHPLNHTGEAEDKFVHKQKLMEEEDKRAGTKLIIDEEDFTTRACNRLGRDNAMKRQIMGIDHSPDKFDFSELMSKSFDERLLRERKLKRPPSEEEAAKDPYKPKKQKASRPVNKVVQNIYIPDLPVELENAIKALKGRRVKLLIQKELTKTDTSRSHNRLSIMQSQFRDPDFLTEEEKKFLNTRVGPNPAQKRVKFIHPSGEEGQVTFKKWDLKSSLQYVFITEWSRICERNGLTEGVVVQVWSFRTPDDELGFALARL